MDQNTMLLLGMIKLRDPSSQAEQLVEIKGFDVLAFFLPFVRLISNGMWKMVALYCFSICLVIPIFIWAWYMGFNFKRMKFEHLIAKGWVVVNGTESTTALQKAA